MQFSEIELRTISNAVRVAAEAFEHDARMVGHPGLTAQFETQATQCRTIYDRIGEEIGALC